MHVAQQQMFVALAQQKGAKMSKETYDLDDLVEDAVDVLKDLYKEDPDIDLEDSIPEVVDGVTPIYYYDIYMYAANNFWLGKEIPEVFGGECAWKQIQGNIYEYVSENLYGEKMDEIRGEKDD